MYGFGTLFENFMVNEESLSKKRQKLHRKGMDSAVFLSEYCEEFDKGLQYVYTKIIEILYKEILFIYHLGRPKSTR